MLNELAKEIHKNAADHGWWDEERSFGEIIALCHSELSEALEEYRGGNAGTYYPCPIGCPARRGEITCRAGYDRVKCTNLTAPPKPEGIPIELADCIIRILDYCGKSGIDIDEAIRIKHEYNKTRPWKHGGKVI